MRLATWTCLSDVLLWLATYTNWFLILPMNSDGIYYPFEVLIAFNKKAIKLQNVINSITIHCHNTSKGIRIKILVTSSGNIRKQLVYVANHNKTFERHVQVSSFIWETPNILS